jgi:pimeloyl-ACP methyl ester carboxylesterase
MNTRIYSFKNSQNYNLKAIGDFCTEDRNVPVVIIIPGFGKTSIDYSMMSMYLSNYGLNVFRCDPTNHTGESEGEIFNFTLTGLYQDIKSAVSFVKENLGYKNIGLCTFSLGARAGIRALANIEEVSVMAVISPVVDMKYTLNVVSGEDLCQLYLKNEEIKSYEILRECVGREFMDDLYKNNWVDEVSTKNDVSIINDKHILSIHGDRDRWINPQSVINILSSNPNTSFIVLRDAVHELNLVSAKIAMKHIVSFFIKELLQKELTTEEIEPPAFSKVVKKVKEDRKVFCYSQLETRV